jgi:hypothetical protein
VSEVLQIILNRTKKVELDPKNDVNEEGKQQERTNKIKSSKQVLNEIFSQHINSPTKTQDSIKCKNEIDRRSSNFIASQIHKIENQPSIHETSAFNSSHLNSSLIHKNSLNNLFDENLLEEKLTSSSSMVHNLERNSCIASERGFFPQTPKLSFSKKILKTCHTNFL